MSAQDTAEEDDGPGRREVAHRVFAAEYDDATRSYQEGEEERAPTYVVTPSGAKANRLFLVGVLTEVEQVNDQMLRARVVDPTGAFVVYAGQYQPDARATFDRADPPAFVAVTGKARTFEPEDGDRVLSSVRPESVSTVDADTRDRWVVETARATLDRVGEMAAALASGDHGTETGGVALALDHYGTTPGYLAALRKLAVDAAGVVAGDRDEVTAFDAAPDDDRPADIADLTDLLDADTGPGSDAAGTDTVASGDGLDTGTSASVGTDDETDTDDTAGADANAGGEEIEEIDAGGEVASFDDDADDFEVGGDLGETSTGDDDLEDFDAGDDLGDFEAGESDAGGDDLGDFEADADGDDTGVAEGAVGDGEMYEMDDEERERIESEYGTEFATGTEVDAPGKADIDTPAPEDADVGSEDTGEREPTTDDGADDPAATTDDTGETADESAVETGEDGAGRDIDEVLLERMHDLDDGDGADRETLVTSVVEATGADPDAVEDAIQDALMSGRCYEPGEDRLKPI